MPINFTGVLFEKLGAKGSRIEKTFSVPWDEAAILEVFGDSPAQNKHEQQLFSCAVYFQGASRGNAGLNSTTAAVLDCDCADVGELSRISDLLRKSGLAFMICTSWSHGLRDKVHSDTQKCGPFDCFRVIIPFSRELSPAEHGACIPALYGHEVPADPPHYALEALGLWIPTPSGREKAAKPRGWDPVSARPTQPYFLPSAFSTVDVYYGKPLDVDAVLARPTTAKPTQRMLKPYLQPDRDAVAALGKMVDALSKTRQVEASHAGWHRAPCPACAPGGVQRSPSFTFRANGDGVDMYCHSNCTREDLLSSMNLDHRGALRAPSALRLLLDEQLDRQSPPEAIPVDQAATKLAADIAEAVASRAPTVIQYPAGTGKSWAAASVLAQTARKGLRIAYSTQEHVVARETRSLLPPDVRARSVHIHSALLEVDGPPCRRADELKDRVFEFGVSLMGSVCPRCPYKESCEALANAQARAKNLDEANVIFVSHAGIGQVFGPGKGDDVLLIVDEMPGVYEQVSVTREQLKHFAEGAIFLPSVDTTAAHVLVCVAKAWMKGEHPGEVVWGPDSDSMGDAKTLCQEWGRLRLREGAHPKSEERAWLKAGDALVRLCAHESQGGILYGVGAYSRDDVTAMLPGCAHEALVRRSGVLLSATPMTAALPGFKLAETNVTDGAKVSRTMILSRDRGSKALTETFYDDAKGVRERRPREPGEEPGVPWPAVEDALTRAMSEADKYDCKRVLFVTFKELADRLRSWPSLVDRVEVAHFGALRGKNDWMEGRPAECSVAYLFGTPRFAVLPIIRQLGFTGEAADQAWVNYAAGELTQAEGRLRLPRRTKPCSVMVEGDIAPLTWHAHNVNVIIEPNALGGDAEMWEGALMWRPLLQAAAALGEVYVPGCKIKNAEALRALSAPGFAESCGLYARMGDRRRKTHDDLFSWIPND